MQNGIVYRYFRVDADKDVSGDTLALSLDSGVTWIAGATYIASGSLPPSVAAVNSASPPAAGRTGYWWQILSGPGQLLPLATGRNVVRGRLTDSPEVPHFAWTVNVGNYE
jgi:hypothetical protein